MRMREGHLALQTCFLMLSKIFNETFNDFFNNRVGGVCVAGRWRVKPDSVKKCLNPCKTAVKIPL